MGIAAAQVSEGSVNAFGPTLGQEQKDEQGIWGGRSLKEGLVLWGDIAASGWDESLRGRPYKSAL